VLEPADAYALWAERYPPRPHNPLMEAEQAAMAPLLVEAAPVRALDVGTGTGRYLPLLAAAGARTIVGLDASPAMLAPRSFPAPRILGDVRRLPFGAGSFDLVCSSLMAGDLPDLGAWIGEAARVLMRGGHLVYSDFHPAWSARGWRRTFQAADGRPVEVRCFHHALEDHLVQLARSAMTVRVIREPRVLEQPAPAVIVFHATRSH
jgi:malonyl-CoA O-methyltransferase